MLTKLLHGWKGWKNLSRPPTAEGAAEEWRKAWDQIKNVGHNEEGYSLVGGFIQFERDRMPREFDLLIFSADATLPVIDLHAYNTFYPSRQRWVPGVQHVFGWWLISVFLASVTVL